MTVSYDELTKDFLEKVTEYNFLRFDEEIRQQIIDQYVAHAVQQFSTICKRTILAVNPEERLIDADCKTEVERDEVIDIITEGMLVQWMKPFMYKQENLENLLNTSDFSAYSPAELLKRVTEAYNMCKKDFTNRVRSYTYDHGDLTDLHI